jgi:hypothetical protein
LAGFISIRQHVVLFIPFGVVKQLQQGQISFALVLRDVVKIGEAGTADWWSARPTLRLVGRVGRAVALAGFLLGGQSSKQEAD